jgi:hypothetical protein
VYCSKNSDEGNVKVKKLLYEGHEISPNNKLETHGASRIASASECFAAICGNWRHHMKPAVQILGIHLEGKEIVATSDFCSSKWWITVLTKSYSKRSSGNPGSVRQVSCVVIQPKKLPQTTTYNGKKFDHRTT